MANLGDLGSFSRLILALDPWLDRIVIIGGWAHRLYRLHPRSQTLDYQPITTLDADIALPEAIPAGKDAIRERLLAGGFTEEFLGDHRPPATHYRLGDETSGFYAEFLSPLVGSRYDRMDNPKATARIGGITAQRLRYIGLLLAEPWHVSVDLVGVAGRRTVRITDPIRFLAQKILIHPRRHTADRVKDILYIHDTLEAFGADLENLRSDWARRIAPQLRSREAGRVRRAADTLFAGITDDIRSAALLAAGRSVSPESVRETCHFGLHALFG